MSIKVAVILSFFIQTFCLCLCFAALDYGFSFDAQMKTLLVFDVIVLLWGYSGVFRGCLRAMLIGFPLVSFFVISQLSVLVDEDETSDLNGPVDMKAHE